MSKRPDECLSELPRPGIAVSELTLSEIIGLQGWTLDDLAENRQGRLSAPQKLRLMEGHSELFGLLHIRAASKPVIEAGLVESHTGVARSCHGASMAGPSTVLTVDDRDFLWTDEETFRGKGLSKSAQVIARRLELLEHWVAQGQRVRVYSIGNDNLIAVEPVTA